MKDIGIRRQRHLTVVLLGVAFVVFSIICAIMWAVYEGNYFNDYIKKNGVEVDAECTNWYSRLEDDMHRTVYYCTYKYVDDSGKEYFARRRYYTESEAMKQLYTKITCVIDPQSTHMWICDLNYFGANKVYYARDLTLAIIFSLPVPVVFYLFIYRGIYRSLLDYKIRERVGEKVNDFINGSEYSKNSITEGEVTKTIKWIVGYVKVKYRDENEETQERWARSWFTRKETKFLEQKKFINIVPYKNTYGILEEMPIEYKQKSAKSK